MALTGTLHHDLFDARTVAGGWGTSTDGHTYIVSPTTDHAVNVGNGEVTLPDTVSHNERPSGALTAIDMEAWVELLAPSAIPAGGNETHYVILRRVDTSNLYRCRVVFNTAQRVTIIAQRVVAGASSDLVAQITLAGTFVLSSVHTIRFKVTGSGTAVRIQAAVGAAGDPGLAMIDFSDTDPTRIVAPGEAELRHVLSAGFTGAARLVKINRWDVDTLDVVTPPPDAPVVDSVPNPVGASPYNIAYTLPTAGSVGEVSIDGGAWVDDPSPASITVAAGDTHAVDFRARGTDGQHSTIVSRTVHRDALIPGTTGPDYMPVTADLGGQIRAVITPINASGAGSPITTPWSPVVQIAGAAPTVTTAVGVSGSTSRGQTLAAVPGEYAGGGTVVRGYQWLRGGVPISGANQENYTTTDEDVGAAISVTETATNAGGSVSSTSAETAAITLDPPTYLGAAGITGPLPFEVGDTLTLEFGDWDGSLPMGFTQQWKRSPTGTAGTWVAIAGAQGTKYTVQDADEGQHVGVTLRANNGVT